MAARKRTTARSTAEPDVKIDVEHAERLLNFGYFGNPEETEVEDLLPQLTPAKYVKAVKQFQKFRGLISDGIVGPVTERELYYGQRRCALPDILPMVEDASSVCKWSFNDILWHQTVALQELDQNMVEAAFTQAYKQWADVCGIKPTRATGNQFANIFSESGTGSANNLDGRGGTLAWSTLPCGNTTRKTTMRQMYDSQESWSYNMLVAVACHEIGHALGLPHLAAGNLMAPYYNRNITTPQAGDIKEIVARYGRATTPTPTPTPDPTPCQPFEITIVGTIIPGHTEYKLTPAT